MMSAQLMSRGYGVLLHRMDQFMSQQSLSFTMRLILTCTEYYVLSHRKGKRIHSLCRFSGTAIRVHAHLAEIVIEARLEKGAYGPRQRLAAAPHGVNLRLHI